MRIAQKAVALAVLQLVVLSGCSHGGADDIPPARQGQPTFDTSPVPPLPRTPAATQQGCAGASLALSPNVVCEILSSFGDPQSDNEYVQEINNQSPFWGTLVTPRFYKYRECSGGNALSYSNQEIAFGQKLFQDLKRRYSGVTGLRIVLAHEWAHQIQYKLGTPRESVRTIELEADALAGYFMFVWHKLDSNGLNESLDVLYNLGDESYNDPTHHGTPIERKYMALYGMSLAKNALENGIQVTWLDLDQTIRSEIGSKMAGHFAGFVDPAVLKETTQQLYIPAPRATEAELARIVPR